MMSRRRTIWLAVAVVLLVLGGAFLWALPELVRRQAVTRIPMMTGRAASIEDIDLNLFTGRLVVKNFRLTERDPSKAFVEFERLEARWSWPSLLVSTIDLKDVRLVSPTVHLVRTGPREFNFSDLLNLIPPADPKAKPSRWTFTMERLGLVLGSVVLRDDAVSPPATWRLQGLTIEAGDLTTRAGQPAGHLAIQSKVGDSPFQLSSNEIRLAPGAVSLGLGIKDFNLTQLLPYVPPTAPAGPYAGRLGFNIRIGLERGAEGVTRAVVTGDMSLDDLQLIRPGGAAPFMTVPRLSVKLKEADLLSRIIVISAVEIDGLKVQAQRDKNGIIDLLQPVGPPPAASPKLVVTQASPSPASSDDQAGPAFKFLLERLALTKGTATFVDDAVSPRTTLVLGDLGVTLESLAWPAVGPARLAAGAGLPGGGRLEIKGSLIPQPVDVTWSMTVRDAPIEPYQSYLPVPARFSGRFNGDSKNRVAFKDGKMILTSKGSSWADKFEARFPGAERPTLTIERMDLVDIDLDWPKSVRLGKAGFRRPQAEVERGTDGRLDIVKLFGGPASATPASPVSDTAPAVAPADAKPPAAKPPAAKPPAAKPKGLLEVMSLQFDEIRVEEGSVRFLDRSTEPAFSEDMSKMELQVTGLGNKIDQRAKLVFTSSIGADGGLDVRGDVGAVGAPLYLDLVGEIRDLRLPVVNPYSDQTMAWLIKQGNLQYKFNLKIENDQITSINEVVVQKLRVAKSTRPDDHVKARLGLPLGLIVALIKDGNGNIVVKVPVGGSLKDPKFDLSETIWAAIKHVLVNVLSSPFRLIGSLFSSAEKIEEPKVNPVTFAPGSAVLSPAMEQHVLRVADFMRQTPYVALTLHPFVTPADLSALKAEAVAAKIQQFAKERRISEQVMAMRGYFAVRLPSEKLLRTVDEQLALLRDREPVPEARLKALEDTRLAVTKERLVKREGIQDKRLPTGAATKGAGPEGGLEFGIGEHEAD